LEITREHSGYWVEEVKSKMMQIITPGNFKLQVS